MIDLNCKINFKKILEIVKNGFSVQVKNLNYNFMMIFINNKIMRMNNPSKNLAAHVIMSKLYQLGSIFHSGLSSVGSIIIPIEKIDNNDKVALSRLNKFGNIIGIIQFTLILGFKFLINLFTSDEIVIKECYKILFPLALLEYLNSLCSVYEGTLQGYKKYNEQALIAFFSFSSIILGLKYCTNLSHIWYSILGMSFIRLITSYLIVKF
jgi:Na+-driven multidrug efflux pump